MPRNLIDKIKIDKEIQLGVDLGKGLGIIVEIEGDLITTAHKVKEGLEVLYAIDHYSVEGEGIIIPEGGAFIEPTEYYGLLRKINYGKTRR